MGEGSGAGPYQGYDPYTARSLVLGVSSDAPPRADRHCSVTVVIVIVIVVVAEVVEVLGVIDGPIQRLVGVANEAGEIERPGG